MYTSIVVPLDGSKRAEQVIPYVSAISAGFGSQVKLVRAIPPIPPELAAGSRAATPGLLMKTLKTLAQDYLEKVAGSLAGEGLDVSWRVCEGDPASSIVEEADQAPDSLIIAGTHGWTGDHRWDLGSVTLKVLQAAPGPVLVVPARQEAAELSTVPLSTVMVPLDGSALSEAALPHAVALASKLDLKVVLLRAAPDVWDYYPYLDHTVLHYGDLSRDMLDRAASYLDEVSGRLQDQGLGTLETVPVRGNPSDAIIDFAQRTPGSLVAMASHGQGSAATYRGSIGSVAQRVAGGCSRPVLVVRGQ